MTKIDFDMPLIGSDVPEGRTGVPLRFCVVSDEFLGLFRNGGIGTASTGLVEFLAREGHEVVALNGGGWTSNLQGDFPKWYEHYRQKGVELMAVPDVEGIHSASIPKIKAFAIYQFLKTRPWDVIIWSDANGLGYYSLLAKDLGLHFQNTRMSMVAHGISNWHNSLNQRLRSFSAIELSAVEIGAVEMVEELLSPSRYMAHWIRDHEIRLPPKVYHAPYLIPNLRRELRRAERVSNITEFCFFGRLEVRKGLILFCEAVSRLARHRLPLTITFVGKPTHIANESVLSYLARQAADWPFEVRFKTEFGQPEALNYLRKPGRLAVMPSLADNSPCVIYEALSLGIPFLASSQGGGPELVAPEYRDAIIFDPDPDALAECLLRAATRGVPIPDASREVIDIEHHWRRWLSALEPAEPVERGEEAAPARSLPVRLGVLLDCALSPNETRQSLKAILDELGGVIGPIVIRLFAPESQHQAWSDAVEEELRFFSDEAQPQVLVIDGTRAAKDEVLGWLSAGDCDFVLMTTDCEAIQPGAVHLMATLVERGDVDLYGFFARGVGPGLWPEWLPVGGHLPLAFETNRNPFTNSAALCRWPLFAEYYESTLSRDRSMRWKSFFLKAIAHGHRYRLVPDAVSRVLRLPPMAPQINLHDVMTEVVDAMLKGPPRQLRDILDVFFTHTSEGALNQSWSPQVERDDRAGVLKGVLGKPYDLGAVRPAVAKYLLDHGKITAAADIASPNDQAVEGLTHLLRNRVGLEISRAYSVSDLVLNLHPENPALSTKKVNWNDYCEIRENYVRLHPGACGAGPVGVVFEKLVPRPNQLVSGFASLSSREAQPVLFRIAVLDSDTRKLLAESMIKLEGGQSSPMNVTFDTDGNAVDILLETCMAPEAENNHYAWANFENVLLS